MNVIDIVSEYLKLNEYDGLVQKEGECGCELDDLHPCDDDMSTCKPAYKHMTNGCLGMGEEWCMSINKDWTPKDNE